jgi:hypothetical protein
VWHTGALVRDPGGTEFTLYVDGAAVNTDATDPGTDATSPSYPACGNWHVTAAVADEPLEGTISELGIIDTAMSVAQIDAYIADGTVPSGMTELASMSGGTDAGDVYTVDATEAAAETLTVLAKSGMSRRMTGAGLSRRQGAR